MRSPFVDANYTKLPHARARAATTAAQEVESERAARVSDFTGLSSLMQSTLTLYNNLDRTRTTPGQVTNIVHGILRPMSLDFGYNASGVGTVTNSYVLPDYASAEVHFVPGTADASAIPQQYQGAIGYVEVASAGELRNYSLFIDEINYEGADPYSQKMSLDFNEIIASNTVYATPAFEADGALAGVGWVLTTNDVPCTVTVRQNVPGVVFVERQKLAKYGAGQ